ncbi:hypothetical protein, conserved in T. vivax [Trypanosoma vivax Y486]|uniref:Uncharacterized protein n=1 Tax=Trypanosoma vivax (strain Y486) TaxID=1055687 RepID=F9WSY5_TRYVY|nr:hypothetical protein, conserved in T. vivax [Trypanosoma vivax Y486]|eukprot:CCD20674.1 hypothetical protein, conserved in T. vivax [Trypanosoma vivax Y486]
MRDETESFAAVGREEHVVEETGQRGTGEGIGPRTGVGEAWTRSPRAVADGLTKMAESYAMQAVYGSRQQGAEGQKGPDGDNATNKLLTMLRGKGTTNGGFDQRGNDEGLILPMILLCNDGRPSTACGTGGGTTCPCSTAAVPASGLAHTEAKDKVWSVLKATSGTNMGSSQDLIVGNWLITKHICENHTTHVRSLGTAADLAAQLEHAAHAIVHAMKPSGITAGYNQQKMCLGQVVSSKACDGDTSSSAYACACFDKAAAANRGQGIKFINHLLAAANALRSLQRLRDDVKRHNAAHEKHRISAKENRSDTGNTGKINTSARAGKGGQEQQTNVAAGKGAAATTESACEQMGGQWDANRQACSAAQQEKRRTPPVKQGETPQKRTSQATWEQ